MTDKKHQLLVDYGLSEIEEETYNITLERSWIEQLARHSQDTLTKLLGCDNIKQTVDEKGNSSWYLALTKKYGFTVAEINAQSNDTEDYLPIYYGLSRELLKSGYPAEQIEQLILEPQNWEQLNPSQIERATKIFNGFLKAQQNSNALVTLMFNRFCPFWTEKDSDNLSKEFFNAVFEFSQKEDKGWVEDEKEEVVEGKSSPPSTIAIVS